MSMCTMEQIKKLVISAYDHIADAYAGAYSENDAADFKYFDYFVSHLSGKKILDMGCGIGVNSRFLADKGLQVIGVDASEKMLNNARKRYPDLMFERQDILHTRYPDNSFDGIVLAYVIEHFNDEGLVQLKNEISRILRKGGLLYIVFHEGNEETVIADPLDESVSIYYNFLTLDRIDSLFGEYRRVASFTRHSYGPEEFINDKIFITYQKGEME